jgi:hypothetical protein
MAGKKPCRRIEVFVNLILDRSFPMSIDVVSPLRQRMIEDMTARKLGAGTQRLYISSCKRFGFCNAHLIPPPSRTSAASSCTSPRQGRASPTATGS